MRSSFKEYTEERQFNMALAYLEGFDNLLRARDEAAINKDFEKWRRILTAIATRFDFLFEKDQKEIIEAEFKLINTRLFNLQRVDTSKDIEATKNVERLLDGLTKLILGYLHAEEIIFPVIKKSEGWTKEIEKDF